MRYVNKTRFHFTSSSLRDKLFAPALHPFCRQPPILSSPFSLSPWHYIGWIMGCMYAHLFRLKEVLGLLTTVFTQAVANRYNKCSMLPLVVKCILWPIGKRTTGACSRRALKLSIPFGISFYSFSIVCVRTLWSDEFTNAFPHLETLLAIPHSFQTQGQWLMWLHNLRFSKAEQETKHKKSKKTRGVQYRTMYKYSKLYNIDWTTSNTDSHPCCLNYYYCHQKLCRANFASKIRHHHWPDGWSCIGFIKWILPESDVFPFATLLATWPKISIFFQWS